MFDIPESYLMIQKKVEGLVFLMYYIKLFFRLVPTYRGYKDYKDFKDYKVYKDYKSYKSNGNYKSKSRNYYYRKKY